MKKPSAMKYREMEQEVITNRQEMAKASLERKRQLINRNHSLMLEMDARWNSKTVSAK